jgi:hypothetical protein
MVGDTGTDDQIWQGVMAYNRGVGGAKAYLNTYGTISSYAQNVKAKVQGADGYLGQVKDAISAARDAANAQSGAAFDPGNAIPQSGFTNTASQLNNLFFVKKSDHTVDLEHVDYRLLSALNSLGTATGRLITVTSGYRYTGTPNDGAGAAPGGHDTQWYLWNRYKNSGFQLRYIAAKPGTSNHERGQACDCTVGGVKIARAFPASILAIYNLNCTVEGDDEHITLIGVSG